MCNTLIHTYKVSMQTIHTQNENPIDDSVAVISILVDLGFKEVHNGLEYDFGNCTLTVIESINFQMNYGLNFMGFWTTPRSMGEIGFFLPLKLDSYQLCLALISYYLRQAKLQTIPPWLTEGLGYSNLLPWEIEMKAYENNPTALVDSSFIKPIFKKLLQLSLNAVDSDRSIVSFQANNLSFKVCGERMVCHADGDNWLTEALISTKSFSFLPKKLRAGLIPIYIWKEELRIGNRAFRLIDA